VVPLVADALIQVWSRVRAVAISARVAHTVVDICTVLTIAAEAIGTISTHEPFKWCSNICTCHTLEARLPCTVVSVTALLPTPSVARAAGAAVLTWSFVIADCIVITVIFSRVTRSNLFTCAVGKHVSVIASTVVGVGSHICAAASVATWVAHAVVDICTVLTIATEAIGTVIAHEPFKWCSNICTCHTLEARIILTPICVHTLSGLIVRVPSRAAAVVTAYRQCTVFTCQDNCANVHARPV
jgi:hypothetical protein